jgi:undecaprenyl-diphosphatase
VDVWRRHPADVARLVVALFVLGSAALLAAVAPDAVRDASGDLVDAIRTLPVLLRQALLGIAQIVALLGPLVIVGWLLAGRRLRLLGTAAVAWLVASLSMAVLEGWLDRTVPPGSKVVGNEDSWVVGAAFPSGTYLAGVTATILVLGSGASHRWRRAGWIVIGGAALFRLATAVAVPVNIAVTLAVGAAAASLVLLVFGAPMRRLSNEGVAAAIRRLGIDVGEVTEIDLGASHSRTFAGTAPERVVVKLIGRDERAAELLLRTVRRLRVKGLEDDRPGWSAPQTARHEALVGLLAAQAGVAVVPVRAVGETEEGDGLVVFDTIEARRLVDLDHAELDDELLVQVFAAVHRLHTARIAHRSLDATNLAVDSDGSVRILDLRWSTLGASDELLAADVAELMVSLALLVGVQRVLDAARLVLPSDRLEAAIALVQPLALSPNTRANLHASPDVLDELRTALASAVGAKDVALAPLARLSVGRVVGWFGSAVLVLLLLAFASNLDRIGDAVAEADWSYLPLIVVFVAIGYVGGALSLLGAVPRPLPLVRTALVMLAQSFLNRFTPANAGGMALRTRYLQLNGSDLPSAAASVGLTSLASGVMQAVMLLTFGLWAGSTDSVTFKLPSLGTFVVGLLAVSAIVGAVVATPWGGSMWRDKLFPSVSKVLGDIRALATSPGKLVQLFGGATVAKLTTILAFVLSCRAFDIDIGFARLVFLYMTANTVASAVPTPGGVGAIEAVLIAVLTGAGVDQAIAASAVLVFRLMTYWLPILPSWITLRYVRKAKYV